MTISGNAKPAASSGRPLHWVGANILGYLALLGRKPRPRARSMRLAPLRLVVAALLGIALLAATMALVDAWAVRSVLQWPEWLTRMFDDVTDFGKSVRFLIPVALALLGLTLLAAPTVPRMAQRVLAAVAVRLGFLLLAIGLPGLVVTITKRVIGRARPLIEGGADPFLYHPLGWSVEYASLPSGHAVDAFAIATAVALLWPSARAVMLLYAVVIALSRVVLTAHFPSDVLAGAIVGVLGALLVREWFATRGLAFAQAPGGRITALPGPSLSRLKRVARQLLAP